MKILLGLLISCLGLTAMADVYDLPTAELVMNKKYRLQDEATLQLGYLPMGAFNKYVAAGGTYTHLFNDTYGWEVINASYAMELAAGLKNDLISYYGAKQSDFAVLKALVTTNYVYSPFYTKSLLFNSSIVYSQLSFVIGGGLANYSILTAPAIDAGVIQRFFLSKSSSLKFDFRYYTFFSSQKTVQPHITLMLGYSFNFGD